MRWRRRLRDANQEAGLVSDAMRVLEARHIYLDSSAEEFLAWVDASLKANGLSKLVYIWDEFSAFMDRNRAELKTLEQLAEAAQQGRFYFVPVTHTDISSYVAAGSESAKKANDRFTFKRLDLPNETALKLAADAFVVKPEKATEWTQERDVLWHSVNGVAENYMVVNKAGIDAADFKGILPLHPMAAFLLKHLSVAIGANQRSMFEFLNGEEFRAFIEKGGLDVSGHQFLTVDHLWRYFVERDDLGTGQAVQEARAEYARREQDLQPDERRVFKAVLLFGLIEQMQGTGHPLLSATVENIQRSFEGDGALQGVDAILRNLEQKHCFTIVNGRCERFRDRSDTKEIEEKKAALDGKFGDLVLKDTETELVKQLKGVNYGGRFDVRAAGVGGLSASSIAKRESFGDNREPSACAVHSGAGRAGTIAHSRQGKGVGETVQRPPDAVRDAAGGQLLPRQREGMGRVHGKQRPSRIGKRQREQEGVRDAGQQRQGGVAFQSDERCQTHSVQTQCKRGAVR